MFRNWNKQIYVIGDIHGDFIGLADIIDEQLENCYLIVLGDCGFGFFKKSDYTYYLNELEHSCKTKHVMVGFIRGNHDDPKFWKDKIYRNEMLNSTKRPHIQFIDDNSFIKNNNNWYYCIGGAISIDRNGRTEGISYWSDENMTFIGERAFIDLKKSLKINKVKGILSHTGPKPFARQIDTAYFRRVREIDPNFINDTLTEQSLVNFLQRCIKPQNWYYGHWHVSETSKLTQPKSLASNRYALDIFELRKIDD